MAIYTTITTHQQQRLADERRQFELQQAAELYQQSLYDDFIDDMYQLHKDGELNDTHNPWAFANARYRVLHRRIDVLRKAQVLQFLKEKQLIGRNHCQTGCEQKKLNDIIRLNTLNFDGIQLSSDTGMLNQLDIKCVLFDHLSLGNARFTNVDLSGAVFDGSILNGVKFIGSTLACVKFDGTKLDGADFGDSNLDGAIFINVNMSTVKLSKKQLQMVTILNTILPNPTTVGQSTIKSTTGII